MRGATQHRCTAQDVARTACHYRLSSRNCRAHAVREPKDPKAFASMEDARNYLDSQTEGPSMQRLLNWLSQSAFGQASSSSIATAYRQAVEAIGSPKQYRNVPESPEPESRRLKQESLDAAKSAQMQRLQRLALLEPCAASLVVRRFPEVASIADRDLAARMVLLKQSFPGCDTRVLIEREPSRYLKSRNESIHDMAGRFQILKDSLVGVDVSAVLHEQPCLVCLDVERGIDELFQLWDVETRHVVLKNSFADELALALRTLSE